MARGRSVELYGKMSKSIPQKFIIHILEILLLWLSFWILFQQGGDVVQTTLGIHNASDQGGRRIIIFVFNVIIFLRLAFMMFYLLKRKIPWEESVSVSFAFALYYIGFSLFVLPTHRPLDWLDFLAILIFVLGCLLNTGGELLRDRWKRKPENNGKIYTEGFFTYSMHINYFGDLLWVTGCAMMTRNWFSASIPLFLFGFFAFYNVPKLDKYLHGKYGKSYERYAERTKKLIPFIY
jgi:protein-S-isoprenylcysteine O-methyltransferase Ste14